MAAMSVTFLLITMMLYLCSDQDTVVIVSFIDAVYLDSVTSIT